MKLPRPFFRLPLCFDAALLQHEIAQLPAAAWQPHPTGYPGNAAVRLITPDGGENDRVRGAMRATPHLERCPYVRQILAEFGVVWGRSRLMRLDAGCGVPEHSDINHHWFHRVRVHIPIVTRPEVRFHCGEATVHMQAGECWVFDNWRLHRVENGSAAARIHLVADTTGSARFWDMVRRSQSENFARVTGPAPKLVGYDPTRNPPLLTESADPSAVLPPSEIDVLVGDLRADLPVPPPEGTRRAALLQFDAALAAFCRDWRMQWSLHGDRPEGWAAFRRLVQELWQQVQALPVRVPLRSNGMEALEVLQARVLAHAVPPPDSDALADAAAVPEREYAAQPPRPAPRVVERSAFDRPVFIVSAPRSGSTLLFETLACSETFWTVGDETHAIVEGLAALRPAATADHSNRLTRAHATPEVQRELLPRFAAELRSCAGARYLPGSTVRFLEKTPKNALRIPFFDALFPDARFIFLWREAEPALGSIMDVWGNPRWVTYPALPGWDGTWSLLLPPGWQQLRGRPLEEIAAFQWERTNRVILEDLAALPRSRWITVSYEEFLKDPETQTRRICAFAEVPFDASLRARTAEPLPLSRYTLTRPDPFKWRKNESAIARVLPQVFPVLARLRQLSVLG